jgi:hypothetical protein
MSRNFLSTTAFDASAPHWRLLALSGRNLKQHTVWRACVALVTAIAFALLVATAATHHHATALEDQGCSLCSVVGHKLSGTPSAQAIERIAVLLPYRILTLGVIETPPASPLHLPPSCGPPAFQYA